MVSSNHGVNQALVQLVWPCHGQALGLTPPGALAAAHGSRPVLPVGAPLLPSQDASAVQRAEHVRGCSPPAMLCNPCLGVHGSPGDRSRVGKMLNHSDTKAFPSSAGTCPRRCFDVQPLALIRAHRSTFRNLSVGGPWSLPSHDPPGPPLRSAISCSQESRCCSLRCVCFHPSVSSRLSPPPIPPWRNVACAPKAAPSASRRRDGSPNWGAPKRKWAP